ADEAANDPTVERCERRAVAGGYGGVIVLNLFALRSTDPAALSKVDDPIGPENDDTIRREGSQRGSLICAWGKHGRLLQRDHQVLAILREMGVRPHCLGTNGDGTPKHPLYVPYGVTPVEFSLQP